MIITLKFNIYIPVLYKEKLHLFNNSWNKKKLVHNKEYPFLHLILFMVVSVHYIEAHTVVSHFAKIHPVVNYF